MEIGAIIPAFNAGIGIASVIKELKSHVGNKIIVVNDGSTDGTATYALKENVIVLSHKHNRGKGAALRTGFSKAIELNWDAVITLDADGQHNPIFVPYFIGRYKETGADIIIGSRMCNLKSMPPHRILSNRITSKILSWRIGQKIIDSQCGYRLISIDVLNEIELLTSHYDTESEIIIRSGLAGFRIDFVDIETIYNNEASSINLVLDTMRFIKLYWSSFFIKY
ncbi:glycosyltransferase [candidate division KSB1 bacterium]|nr:glycosyltransferase [candidate division KSB1 bacterium]